VPATTLANEVTLRAQPCQYGFISELVIRCGRGDDTALAQLFNLFYEPVAGTIASTTPGPQVAAAVKDVFVTLWRRAPHYQPGQQRAVSWVMALVPQPESDRRAS
jgi:hypothetical protein